ncbi:MAG: hypothetical protein KF773_34695 [Deltaproteobacteria bacterium]|nr:hypothetical protein [Deltaproteobacteria bacterium]
MIRVVVLAVAIVSAACSSDPGPPVGGGGGSGGSGAGSSFELLRDDMPDPAWADAALSLAKQWHESFTQLGVSRAIVQPFRAPDQAVVPYLFRVQAEKGGKPVFRSTALLWKGAMINTAGPAKAGAFLGSLGFPGKPLAAGHVVEILHVTKAVDAKWLKPPSANGWEAVPAEALAYADGKATLTLAGEGGARLVVTFASNGAFTTAEAKP